MGQERLDAAAARFETLALRHAGLLAGIRPPGVRLTERGMSRHGELLARLAPD